MKRKLSLLALALCASTVVQAQAATERLTVQDAWVRLNAPGTQVAGAFMQLKNSSDKDIQLVKAESPAARITELHSHSNEGGVMKMRQVAAIAVKAKGETALKPGSYHVMLIDLKAPLKEGDMVPITLGFNDGSSKKIDVKVVKPAAEGHQH